MAERDALLAAVLRAPADDLPRLVMADWLQDNGEPERGEFIRVQCELARVDPHAKCGGYYCQTYDTGNVMHVDCRGERLRNRERELWPSVIQIIETPTGGGLTWVTTADWIPGTHPPTWGVATVRRGFVSHVTVPTLDTLLGAVCGGGCFALGTRWVVRHPKPRKGSSAVVICPACSGTGRAGGVARELFSTQPVEAVTVGDVEIFPSGGNLTYYVGGLGSLPSKYWRSLEGHPTRRAATQALSAALVDWCRELAGLTDAP